MKNENNTKKNSKFLSLVLRHKPEVIGLSLDEAGWTYVEELLEKLNAYGKTIDRELLEYIVANNDKKRFEFSDDGLKIRASQGHSISIDLGYEPQIPPETLFHGTTSQFLEPIFASGLKKMKRHHVHLSADKETAQKVGSRRGNPVILEVAAGAMHRAGHLFFVTQNGVWLTDHVPAEYLR